MYVFFLFFSSVLYKKYRYLQQCNYQVSKEVVHELEFGDYINNLQKRTGILILIGSLGCLKVAKTMDMMLVKNLFPNSFPYFQ